MVDFTHFAHFILDISFSCFLLIKYNIWSDDVSETITCIASFNQLYTAPPAAELITNSPRSVAQLTPSYLPFCQKSQTISSRSANNDLDNHSTKFQGSATKDQTDISHGYHINTAACSSRPGDNSAAFFHGLVFKISRRKF